MSREFKRISKSGGISIPVKLRRELNMQGGDAVMIEEQGNGDIVIRKYSKKCVLCGKTEKDDYVIVKVDGKDICKCCYEKIAEEMNKEEQADE